MAAQEVHFFPVQESLDEDALWGAAKSAATTGAHQKLAALFTCVSLGETSTFLLWCACLLLAVYLFRPSRMHLTVFGHQLCLQQSGAFSW